MTLRKFLILRKPRSGCLEGRTAQIQLNSNSFTRSQDEAVFDGIKRTPHPEEAAERPSRRTHRARPVQFQFPHPLESGNPGGRDLSGCPLFNPGAGSGPPRTRG